MQLSFKKRLNNKDREILKKRYNYHCVICDKYTKYPQFAHIRSTQPKGPGTYTQEKQFECLENHRACNISNHVNNCILVCSNCHQNIDRYPEKYHVDYLEELRIKKLKIYKESKNLKNILKYKKLLKNINHHIFSIDFYDNYLINLMNEFTDYEYKSKKWIQDWFNIQKNLLKHNKIIPFNLFLKITIQICKYYINNKHIHINIKNLINLIDYINLCIRKDLKILKLNNISVLFRSTCTSEYVSKYTSLFCHIAFLKYLSNSPKIFNNILKINIHNLYSEFYGDSFKNFLFALDSIKYPQFDLIKYYILIIEYIFDKNKCMELNKKYIEKYTQKGLFIQNKFKFDIQNYLFNFP